MPDAPPEHLSDEVQAAVDAYAERLGELLACCVRDQDADPEAFLWNARRSLEAMVLLLLAVHLGKVTRHEQNDRLHGLIDQLAKRRVLGREDVIRFQRAREYSNLGVHISKPEREDYRKARDDLRHLLPGIVEWLYQESIAAPHLQMSAEARLHNRIIDLRALPASPPAPTEPAPAAPVRRRGWVLFTALAASSLVISATVSMGLLGWADSPDAPDAPRVLAEAPRAQGTGPGAAAVVAGPIAEVPPVEAPAAEPPPEPPAPDPVPPDCPPGMVGIAASTLQLGQPVGGRGDWPPATRTRLPPQDVAPFCIDAQERSLAELRAWGRTRLSPDADCDWRTEPEGPEAPAVCVDRDEAAAYCAQVVPGGRLPRIVEWEAVARAVPSGGVRTRTTREWVADDFPPTVLARAWPDHDPARPVEGLFRQDLRDPTVAAMGNVLHSWNRQEAANRWRNLGFRCAISPG